MTFTALGNFGHANSKGTATGFVSVLTLTPTGTINAGELAVVWFAADSYHPGGGNEGDPVPFTSKCVDDAGNRWLTLAGGTDGQSNIYSECVVFVCLLEYALTTSSTLTVSAFVGTSGQVAPRAISLEAFSITAGNTVAVHDTTAAKVTNRGVDPGAITLGGGASGVEYLYLHALSAEAPNTDTYTWDANYTEITGDGTTGGTDDSNIQLRGGYRIATITTSTVDVTATTPTRDYTQVLQAVTEIPTVTFPQGIPLYDDFIRADEDPLGTALGNWDTGSCGPSSNGATPRRLQLVSNRVIHNSTDLTLGGSWHTTALTALAVGEAMEAYVTLVTADAGWLVMQGTGCSETATANGVTLGSQAVAGEQIDVSWVGASAAQQGNADDIRWRCWLARVNGMRLGMHLARIASSPALNYLYFFLDTGDGWRLIGAIHGVANFAGYVAANPKLGLEVQANATRFGPVYYGKTVPPATTRKRLPYLHVGA